MLPRTARNNGIMKRRSSKWKLYLVAALAINLILFILSVSKINSSISTDAYLNQVQNMKKYFVMDEKEVDQINVDELYNRLLLQSSPSLSTLMKEVLNTQKPVPDSSINILLEKKRCEKFNKVFHYRNRTKRRRIFAGGLIADDSWHVIGANALESYGIFHSITFIESNRTQNFHPRSLRFVPNDSEAGKILQSGIFGPNTPIYIENFVYENKTLPLVREHIMRDEVLKKWKELGMTKEDIGLMIDVDEIVSRDFLRAAQICELMDVNEESDTGGSSGSENDKDNKNFWDTSNNQTCRNPLLRLSVPMMEGSPKCVHKGARAKIRRFSGIALVIGTCIEGIGDESRHPPALRVQKNAEGKLFGSRMEGYGKKFDYSAIPNGVNNDGYYPLYNGVDFRQMTCAKAIYGGTGYHLHNFFDDSAEKIRFKYATYGHVHEHANKVPLGAINADMNMFVKCAHELPDEGNRKQRLENGLEELEKENGGLPVAFQLERYTDMRHKEMVKIVEQDEEIYGRADNFDGHHIYMEDRDLTHKGRKNKVYLKS